MNAGFLVIVSLAALAGPVTGRAQDSAIAGDGIERANTIQSEELSIWLKGRFSVGELERVPPGDVRLEPYSCGCNDKPDKHYPYLIVVLRTPKGDLVTRPESREGAPSFTPLAVRYGTRYCDVAVEENCYGSFPDICEFTDFKYGPYLAAFFPTCKAEELEAVLTSPEVTRYSFN
ncbi:MAG TPA: hypothetical protein VKP66_18235 [Steroidobacteraceae bacterium]|nr:hypothetical protein [Steroidobacteraceae bacterium]